MADSGNVLERAKKDLGKVFHGHNRRRSDDINESNDVKGPNLFVRVKDEFEAIVDSMRPRNDGHKSPKKDSHQSPNSSSSSPHGDSRDAAAKAKNSDMNNKLSGNVNHGEPHPHPHDKETHGMSGDFDENTPISAVKGPSVFERAKEEVEALIGAIHHKKET